MGFFNPVCLCVHFYAEHDKKNSDLVNNQPHVSFYDKTLRKNVGLRQLVNYNRKRGNNTRNQCERGVGVYNLI